MRIWLIKIGEPLPIDGSTGRSFRMGLLAQELVRRGHEVVWWSSTFDHARKTPLYDKDTTVVADKALRLELIHSFSYPRNISVKRILNHVHTAYKLAQRFSAETDKPDLIFSAFPTISLTRVAARFARENDIPFVVDLRDMWPDIFVQIAPASARPVVKFLLQPLANAVRRTFQAANALVGITPQFVQWGLGYANRKKTEWDEDFPFGYTDRLPQTAELQQAQESWRNLGLAGNQEQFLVTFIGNLSSNALELDAVVKAAQILQGSGRNIKFVFCGTVTPEREELLGSCENIILPGWVGRAEIWTLMHMSSVGLLPYPSRFDFVASLPNKVAEYLSAGLPVVSSLKGAVETLLTDYQCGLTYRNRDAEDLANKLGLLYDDPKLREDLALHAKQVYADKFVAEEIYVRLSQHLERLVDSRQNARPETPSGSR